MNSHMLNTVFMSDLKAVQEDYYDALRDLTFNSRPIIQTLTSIADEHKSIHNAPKVIVEAVEKRLKEVCHEVGNSTY